MRGEGDNEGCVKYQDVSRGVCNFLYHVGCMFLLINGEGLNTFNYS